jgi:hypothetical protein
METHQYVLTGLLNVLVVRLLKSPLANRPPHRIDYRVAREKHPARRNTLGQQRSFRTISRSAVHVRQLRDWLTMKLLRERFVIVARAQSSFDMHQPNAREGGCLRDRVRGWCIPLHYHDVRIERANGAFCAPEEHAVSLR